MATIKKLTFDIKKFSTLENINDSQLMIVEMWIVSEGNNAHDLPISREAILKSASSIIGKPVLYKFSVRSGDFLAHEDDEIACGVMALTKSDYSFKEDEEGKLWLVAKAYIWKMYYPEVVEVFDRDKEKAISMEILIVDSEVDENKETQVEDNEITAFSFTGVTLLGDIYNPAIKDAKATIEKFSEFVKETERLLNIKNKSFNENIVKEVKKVTEKFNKVEFAKSYNYTANEMLEEFQKQVCSITYQDGDYACRKYGCRDFCGNYVYMSDYEKGECVAVPYSKDLKLNMAEMKKCRMRYMVEEPEGEMPEGEMPEGEMGCENEVTINLVFSKDEVNTRISDINSKNEEVINNLKAEFSKETSEKNEQITNFQEEIQNLKNENQELLTFKTSILEQEKEQNIKFAIDSVKDVLNEVQIKEWTEKANEYENVDSFKNAIQAFAFTISKNIPETNTTTRIHIPEPVISETNTKKGLWD